MSRTGVTRLYPLLFAVVPVVHLAAQNPGQTRLTTLALVVAALWLVFGLFHLLADRALRGTAYASLTPLVVLAAVAWFYLNPLAQQLMERATGTSVSDLVPIPVGLLLASGFLLWLGGHREVQDRAHAFLWMMSVLLLGWSMFRVVVNEVHARHEIATSALAAELAAPIQTRQSAASSLGSPDIYLIVLDEYANSAVTREVFGFDNREFEDSLRQLGFTIPKLVRSNYTETELSIPSLLNFAYLNELTTELGPRSDDRSLPNYLLEHNRAVRFLRAKGYRFVFFPSEWWRATDHNGDADTEFRVPGNFSLRRALAGSELTILLHRHTLLGALGSLQPVDANYIKQTFEGLRLTDTGGRPTFVFAHLILPHPPYVLDGRCQSPVVPGYVDQVRCTNALVLHLVTALLQRPGRPPIILLQGDHGTGTRAYVNAPTPRSVTPAQARERFGAFGAYYLPGGGGKLFADTVTVVNVLRKVLSYYLGADLTPLPDHLYMCVGRAPFDLAEINAADLN
jgi:hypothetical protein